MDMWYTVGFPGLLINILRHYKLNLSHHSTGGFSEQNSLVPYVYKYGTALVQHCEYARAARVHVVAACGPRVYVRDTQFASSLRVFNSSFIYSYMHTWLK